MASSGGGSSSSEVFVPAILGGRKRKTDLLLQGDSNKRRRVLEDEHLGSQGRRVPLSTISTSRTNVSSVSSVSSVASVSSASPLGSSPSKGALLQCDKENAVSADFNPSTAESSHPPPPTTSANPQPLQMRPSWSEFRRFVQQSSSSNRSSSDESSSSSRSQKTPFPELSWADRNDLWKLLCKKETGLYKRQHGEVLLQRHPSFQPRMRAILLDWLIEVCEVYRLHRETFYLAVDFIDRYLSLTEDMPKNKLQLVGVSCLFIGAKIEEIYPPKLKEFAYVTDGACSEEQILDMELVILKALNWSLCPLTPNTWMKLFLQLNNCDKKPRNENFVNAQFSGLPFSRIMQLIDLCTMDIGSLSFKYSVLVAAALYHFDNEQVALESSGYEWKDISACVNWMSAFAFALREHSPLQPRSFHNIPADNQHNIQTHTVELTMLDRAQERLVLLMTSIDRDSPDPEELHPPIHLGSLELTPPEEEGDVHYNPSASSIAKTTCPKVDIPAKDDKPSSEKVLDSKENDDKSDCLLSLPAEEESTW